jgi:hypothetical protein
MTYYPAIEDAISCVGAVMMTGTFVQRISFTSGSHGAFL